MAFADPTTVLIGATVAQSAGTSTPLASTDRSTPYTGVYSTSDGLTQATISHVRGSRTRSTFRVDLYTTYTDPSTGLTSTVSSSAYLVLNRPIAGFTNTQLKSIIAAVCGFMGQTANQDKFLGLES
jgi:hypothetical protein